MAKIFYSSLLFLAPIYLQAQNFSHKAKIADIAKDGFYTIQLSSELNARAAAHHEDLRLMDNDGKEIPYLLKKEDMYNTQTDFVQYPIIENNSDGVWQTLIIGNNPGNKIDKFIFEMKNAETDRQVKISGSNDREKWFVVRDRFYFVPLVSGTEATIRRQISFPVSDYAYFKVEIRMRDQQALNILKVGYSNKEMLFPSLLKVNGLRVQRSDSNKHTILRFTCTPANRIDKLVFHISAPVLFRREGIIKKVIGNKQQNGQESDGSGSLSSIKTRVDVDPVETIELNAENKRAIETVSLLGYEKAGEFIVDIDNQDNEPLKIDSISAYQLSSSITAELNKSKRYFLYFGDSLMQAPRYDLVYFQHKIPADPPLITHEDVQRKAAYSKDEYDKKKDSLVVWIGLGVIAVILFFITGSMVKKMGKG